MTDCNPVDVDVEKPDEKSIMTYVAQFLKAYPEAGGSVSFSQLLKKIILKKNHLIKKRNTNLICFSFIF